jgi:GxxExxY protein
LDPLLQPNWRRTELKNQGLKAENQIPIKVYYKDSEVGEYFADIVVENQVIIELKAVEQLQKIHEAQLLNYMKATGYKIGLLVNFKYPKAEIRRFIL